MLRIFVDTHILLWAHLEPDRLPERARELLASPDNDVLFSAASIWEVAIKAQLKRAHFRVSAAQLAAEARRNGFLERPVHADVAARVAALPMHHGDPFDRLLIAQAMAEPAQFLTVDARLAPYSELVTVV